MNLKINKKIPLIDQHDKNYMYGGKFGGNFIPETLKKPVEDLTLEFQKLRNNKNFIKKRNFYFKNYIGSPTSFIKLESLSIVINQLKGFYSKEFIEANNDLSDKRYFIQENKEQVFLFAKIIK